MSKRGGHSVDNGVEGLAKLGSSGRDESSKVNDEEVKGEAKTDRRALVVMFISLVLDLLAFTVILPLLPSLLDYYAGHDAEVYTLIYIEFIHA